MLNEGEKKTTKRGQGEDDKEKKKMSEIDITVSKCKLQVQTTCMVASNTTPLAWGGIRFQFLLIERDTQQGGGEDKAVESYGSLH